MNFGIAQTGFPLRSRSQITGEDVANDRQSVGSCRSLHEKSAYCKACSLARSATPLMSQVLALLNHDLVCT